LSLPALSLLPGKLAVCRLAATDPVPQWARGAGFLSITRTDDELSIVCDQHRVPGDVRSERDWAAFKVAGPIEFSVCGVLAGLTAPLADAGISLLAVCTYDTDYLLVRTGDLDRARTALGAAGYRVNC